MELAAWQTKSFLCPLSAEVYFQVISYQQKKTKGLVGKVQRPIDEKNQTYHLKHRDDLKRKTELVQQGNLVRIDCMVSLTPPLIFPVLPLQPLKCLPIFYPMIQWNNHLILASLPSIQAIHSFLSIVHFS